MIVGLRDDQVEDLTEQLKNTITAFRHGISKPYNQPPNLDEKFNGRYLLKLASTFSLPEIQTLLRVSRVREQGLLLLRSGKLHSGEDHLSAARKIIREAEFGPEARMIADSFQTAAEAYLAYKIGKFATAANLTRATIISSQTLKESYGYDMEVRCIHLLRNFVRVSSRAGEYDSALTQLLNLIRFIEGGHCFRPLPDVCCFEHPCELELEERWVMMDQVLVELADLLGVSNDPDLARQCRPHLERARLNDVFQRTDTFLEAIIAASEGEPMIFLKRAESFFSEGMTGLYQSWQEVTTDLKHLCDNFGVDLLDAVGGAS